MVIPALLTAAEDVSLRGAPLAVYVWLLTRLDLQRPTSVKIAGVAITLGMKRHTVSRALRVLVVRGYIERRHHGSDGFHYRLLYNRVEVPLSGPSQAA